MALVYDPRVKETSTTTGTGTYDLLGETTGAQGFVAGIGNGNTCYYMATNDVDWEEGLGTVTDGAPDTLARTSILNSSNGGSAVSWGAGTKTIFCTPPAGQFQLLYDLLSNLAANSALARAASSAGQVSGVSLAASRLLGRGSTGDIAAISVGTGLSFSGTTLNGTEAPAASQAEQEAGSSTIVFTTPGRQHFHPSAVKCWGMTTGGGTPSLSASYNMTSITDAGTGKLTFTIATDFSSANWTVSLSGHGTASTDPADIFISGAAMQWANGRAAGAVNVGNSNLAATPAIADPIVGYNMVGLGDL